MERLRKDKGSAALIIIILLVLIILGVGGWFAYQKMNEKPVYTVTILTKPPGAQIYWDDGYAGMSPIIIKTEEVGEHRIRLSKDLYQDQIESVAVAPGKPMSFEFKLRPMAVGELEVTSDPPGAEVYIDGHKKGTTPVNLGFVPEGKIKIEVKKDGFDTWSKDFLIAPADKNIVKAELQTLYGKIDVNSEPDGAMVYIDGKSIGKTPIRQKKVRKGKLKVEVKKTGYKNWENTIMISSGETFSVSADLMATYGGLQVNSSPSGADVILNGKKSGQTPFSLKMVKKGQIKVEVQKDCYAAQNKMVEIVEGQEHTIDFDLKTTCGDMDIESEPIGAKWYLDGQYMGRTPGKAEMIKQGRHRVRVEQDGYSVWDDKIMIKADQKNSFKAELLKSMGGVSITSVPSDANVYVGGKNVGKTPLELKNLKPGVTEIELKKECFATAVQQVTVIEGSLVDVKMDLKPLCGRLEVDSNPSGATWYLNEKDMGTTPGKLDTLEEGQYSIKIVGANGAQWTGKAGIQVGKTEKILAELKKEDIKKDWTNPLTQIEFVWIPGGCYEMGCSAKSQGGDIKGCGSDELPVHWVCVDGYWIGRYEITNSQYKKVTGRSPSIGGDDFPVDRVSWNDAMEFVEKLNKMSQGKYKFRLPTEAEWEYACRSGGKTEKYAGESENVLSIAWYNGNSRLRPHEVGKKEPNGLKLYDMSGNVWEWCQDAYDSDFYKKPEAKKRNPESSGSSGSKRVLRGGSCKDYAKDLRCSKRKDVGADYRGENFGFRIVRIQ